MITYICHNKNDKTGENLPCTNNRCETSICPSCGGRSDAISEIFWCPECQVPIYEKNCPVCGQEGKKLTSEPERAGECHRQGERQKADQ